MAVFDEAWISAFEKCIAYAEADYQWNLVEVSPHMGVGIYQASNGESYDLLHRLVTTYPDTKKYFSDEFLVTFDTGSKRWGYKVFTNSQSAQISKALKTDDAHKLMQTMLDEFANAYIKVMKRWGITNKKGSVFAATVYHQRPLSCKQIYNAVGNANYLKWYKGALNNAVVGRFRSRQNKVKSVLDKWDGKSVLTFSGKENTKDFEKEDIGDVNPNYGNSIKTYGDTVENNGVGEEVTTTDIHIQFIRQVGKELWVQMDNDYSNVNIRFLKNANGVWIQAQSSSTISNVDDESPSTSTSTGTKITSKNNVQEKFTTGGTTTKKPKKGETVDGVCGKIIATMESLEGKVSYTQASGARMRPNKGTADCSGLTWYCYKKNGYNIGTWTGDQRKNGKQIHGGRCSSWKSSYENDLKPADLIVMKHDSGGGHVEMYMNRKGYVMGIGSAKVKGSRWRTITNLMSSFDSYSVRRIIDE